MHACVCACMRVCGNCIPYLVYVKCVIGLPTPYLLSAPVIADLQLADLITTEECRRLSALRDIVRVQKCKSATVMTKTADVLRRHGLEKESKSLLGKHMFSVFYGEGKASLNCHFRTSIIVELWKLLLPVQSSIPNIVFTCCCDSLSGGSQRCVYHF